MGEKVSWPGAMFHFIRYFRHMVAIHDWHVVNACIWNVEYGFFCFCELSVEVCVGCMVDYTQSVRRFLKRVL